MASVTSIYARALADVVFDSKLDAAKTLEQLHLLMALLRENPELRKVWENPAIAAKQKRAVLDSIAKREALSKQVRNFVAVLIEHRRVYFFDAIVNQLGHELDARMGFAEAQITTARDLSEPEKRALEGQVEKLTGKKVRATYMRDSAVLGGAVVRVGSTIYDGSVLGQLESIRQEIAEGSF
ncbi:MAG TPA: ATP synthase F1 subunit delta [Terriglobales bacterium]|nr:ATP synthase F1 subunit delta [Terriglobales bacterium]